MIIRSNRDSSIAIPRVCSAPSLSALAPPLPRPGGMPHAPARTHRPRQRYGLMCECVRVCARARACVCECVRVRARACVHPSALRCEASYLPRVPLQHGAHAAPTRRLLMLRAQRRATSASPAAPAARPLRPMPRRGSPQRHRRSQRTAPQPSRPARERRRRRRGMRGCASEHSPVLCAKAGVLRVPAHPQGGTHCHSSRASLPVAAAPPKAEG
jgi:hypothetical protein